MVKGGKGSKFGLVKAVIVGVVNDGVDVVVAAVVAVVVVSCFL